MDEPVFAPSTVGIWGHLRDDSDEMAKKKFEKELLMRFQAALTLLQEGNLAEGVPKLEQILAMDELSNCRYRNADFEKLKAACHLNLYRAHVELKEPRKAFYYVLKYLEYEQDNYALAYEFGSGLLVEGFLGAALVYLKRALSFALAKGNKQFAEIILRRLVFAMCMTDDPADLRQMLQLVATDKTFINSELDEHWKSYYTLLNLLDNKKGFSGRFAEELAEWSQTNRKIDSAERAEMECWRTQVQALNSKIRLESVSLKVRPSFEPPDLVQEVVTLKMGRNVTLNEFLKRINKLTENFEKPVRRHWSHSGDLVSSRGRPSTPNFYDCFHSQLVAIPKDAKASRDLPADISKIFVLQQEVRQRLSLGRKEETLTYITSLLVHLGADVTAFQRDPAKEMLVPNPLFGRKEAFKNSFYEGLVFGQAATGVEERRLMEVIQTLLDQVFGEKAREFACNSTRYVFFGPSVFLREDFRINAREIMSIFALMTQFFAAEMRFDELLVFLECFLAFATPVEVRNNLLCLQRQSHLLQTLFDELLETHFVSKAQEYLEAQAGVTFVGANRPQDPNKMQVGGMCSISDSIAGLRLSHSKEWNKNNKILVRSLAAIFKTHSEERMEQVSRVITSEDLPAALVEFSRPKAPAIPRSNLHQMSHYWRQSEHVAVTLANHESVLGHFLNPKAHSLADLEFQMGFLHLDFSEILRDLASQASGWLYLRRLLEGLFWFLGAQGVWDSKQFDQIMDPLLRFFCLNETAEVILNTFRDGFQEQVLVMGRDSDFRRILFQAVVTLMSFGSLACRQLLKLLCRLFLRLFWAMQDWLRYALLFQFFTAHNDTGEHQGSLAPVLQTPTKRIKFLISVHRFLEQSTERNQKRPDSAAPLDQNYVGMILRELERFLEQNYSLKVTSGSLFSYFARVTLQDEKTADRSHVDNYRCPPVKARNQTPGYSAEEARVHKDYRQKVLLEQLQVFIAFTSTVNCLEKLDPFFFAVSTNEPKFGDSKIFQERSIRVVPHLDLRLASAISSKIERILRAFTDFPDLGLALRDTLAHRKLAGQYLIGGPWRDAERAIESLDFQANDHLFVLLVLLARFQESCIIEPSQKFEDDIIAAQFGALGNLYGYLLRKYPFEESDSICLRQFLTEAVSRTRLMASLATLHEPLRPFPTSSVTREIKENECLDALVKLQKAAVQMNLANTTNKIFPDLVSSAFIAEHTLCFSESVEFLKQNQKFLFELGSRRLDFVMLFYFPKLLSSNFNDPRSLLHRIDRLFESTFDPEYALNFKSFARDPKNADRTNLLKLLVLARFLSTYYISRFRSSPRQAVETAIHARGVTEHLQNIFVRARPEIDSTALILDALKAGPATQTGSPNHLPRPKPHSLEPPDDIQEVTLGPSKLGFPELINPSVASADLQMLAPLYTRMAGYLEPRPVIFEELWTRVFQVLLDFILRERKNISGTMLFSLCSILVDVRLDFPFLRDHCDFNRSGLPEIFRKFDLHCGEKDYKIFHVDLALSRLTRCFMFLISTEGPSPLRQMLLHTALRLLKKVEVRPGSLTALGLLLPLHSHLETGSVEETTEFVQALWDSKTELFKMMAATPETDFVWKKLFQRALELILDTIDARLVTQEDRTEVRLFRESMLAADLSKFDLEGILKNAKLVRFFLKRHFEDKPPAPASVSKPIPLP